MTIQISNDKRHFVDEAGRPFFYLADTAWMLLNHLSFDDTDYYLRTRADQAYTVIACTALAEFGGLSKPNANGDLPLLDRDEVTPNPAYFDHVDRVISRADELGLVVALLPTWGDKVQPWNGGQDGIFSPAYNGQGVDRAREKAFAYGAWIARRFAGRDNIIWINGGDRGPSGPAYEEIGQEYWDVWDALARGLRSVDQTRLISFHPPGGYSSSFWFHHTDWLSFNQLQSGHWTRDIDNYRMIRNDYDHLPIRPTLDGEPCYEYHAVQYRLDLGRFDDYDVRKQAYHAMFAGAAGHTYGATCVFQFHEPGMEVFFGSTLTWREALMLPGAVQMGHMRRLFEGLGQWQSLRPNNGLLLTDVGTGTDAVYAMTTDDHRSALIYSSSGKPFILDMSLVPACREASWFSPRTGEYVPVEGPISTSAHAFVPPIADPASIEEARKRMGWLPKVGNDWVLVLG